MVFFRLGGKLSSKEERTSGAESQGSSAADTATTASPASTEKEKKKEKKAAVQEAQKVEPREPRDTRSSHGTSLSASGRVQTAHGGGNGLSVNDFISKTKNQQRQGLKPSGPELIAYARYLGIDPVADHDLLWIAVEALEAPLPSDWTEHFDSNDRVFYYNATTRVSSWTHPLEHVYRETYKTIVNFRNANLSPTERVERLHQLQVEVKQMEHDVHREIAQWSEHTDEQGNRFYFNREERQSTWTDPRPAKCQILYLRMKMLRLLQSGAGATPGFNDAKAQTLTNFNSLAATNPVDDDPAIKRSKTLMVDSDSDAHQPMQHRSMTDPMSDPGTNSDSSEDRKAKKRKKKKKKREAVRLGVPQKLGASQSEPEVGANKGAVRSPGGGGSAGGHEEGGAASLAAGRPRVKGGIRLEPLGVGG